MRISRSVIAAGGVVLVTNTASNPVVNAEVTLSSSQLVQLDCNTFQSYSVIELMLFRRAKLS